MSDFDDTIDMLAVRAKQARKFIESLDILDPRIRKPDPEPTPPTVAQFFVHAQADEVGFPQQTVGPFSTWLDAQIARKALMIFSSYPKESWTIKETHDHSG